MKRYFKKGFDIELEDSLNYPSSEKICEGIATFCSNDKQKCGFVSRNNPVTFNLDGILYETTVNTGRGGYYLFCKEA